ncbi:nSTAND1 domain-containing NTPase [Blastococcus deserti]|uniref:TIR domain-containing protein n=1 Tax=Blastococcus deserti TaxID=2259033 RepID=A0ABW4XBG6_9ACTN
MAKVFVSHSGKDIALAGEVHRWLIEEGHEVFLDQDLYDGIQLGDQWQERLHERLRWADAMVCVLTSSYVASIWCTAELAIAQSRGSLVLPVRADPGVDHPLVRPLQQADLTSNAAAARARLAAELMRLDAAGGTGWPDGRSPFPGLRALENDEHSVFFGRSDEVAHLVSLLRSPALHAERTVLMVVGPSGCGKSSLVRAGLLPVLAADQDWWTLPPVLPGPAPVAALARELAAAAVPLGLPWTATEVRRALDDGDLTALADDLLLAVPGHRSRRLLLVVDQFEELLTQTPAVERTRFARLLRSALTGAMQVVGTLRPEFLDPLLSSPELAGLPTRTQTLRPLRREALRAVIEGPADRAGINIEGDLVTRLVADTGSGEALPLLAYTLARLSDGVTRGGRIVPSRYDELGEVRGVLAGQAEAALGEAVVAGGRQRDQVVKDLLRLVTVDEEGRPTRRRIRRDDLQDHELTELQPFIDRRLLTSDTEYVQDSDPSHVVLGIAHEALLSAWSPLERAIVAASDALRARRRVEVAAAEWSERRHEPALLWERGQLAAALADTGARLRTASGRHLTPPPGVGDAADRRTRRAWPRRRRELVAERVELSAQARDFLRTSLRRDRRRRGLTVAILSALLTVAIVAAIGAVVAQRNAVAQQREAEEGNRLATARFLLSRGDALLEEDPQTALRLQVAAQQIHSSPETKSALVNSVLTTPYAGHLRGHAGTVTAVAFTATGHTLATADDEGAVLLWDLTDPHAPRRLGQPLVGLAEKVTAVNFSADGTTLVTLSDDGTARLWDVTDPTERVPDGTSLPEQSESVTAVTFASDGETLAAAGEDGTVTLWDVGDATAPASLGTWLTGHTHGVEAMALRSAEINPAPSGRTVLATATTWDGPSGDTTVMLWDVTNPKQPQRLTTFVAGSNQIESKDFQLSLAFGRGGEVVAATDDLGRVALWDLADPAQPRPLGPPLTGHRMQVHTAAFTADGQTLATVSGDAFILWDLTDPARPTRLDAPRNYEGLGRVTFDADGQTLVASGALAGEDGDALIWELIDPAQPRRLEVLDVGAPTPVQVLALASEGGLMVTDGYDETAENTLSVWDITYGGPPRHLATALAGDALTGMRAGVFSPHDPLLATVDADGTALLWDLTDPTEPRRLPAPLPGRYDSQGPQTLAFDPDAPVLAAVGSDPGTVLLVDLADPARPVPLEDLHTGDTVRLAVLTFADNQSILATTAATRGVPDADNGVRLWNLADPSHPRRLGPPLTGHTSQIDALAFSPDGRLLASAGATPQSTVDNQRVLLWDLTDPANARPLGTPLAGHSSPVQALDFSPDGRILATGDEDGTVLLWDLADPSSPRRLGSPLVDATDWKHAVVFTPDGNMLATDGNGGEVILWDFTRLASLLDDTMERACSITDGGLDPDEWRRYVSTLNYRETCAT